MLIEIKGDLVKDDYPIICHQVNCQGVMGSGIAKQIREKYPQVFLDYKEALDYKHAGLGDIVVSYEGGINGKQIISMFSQDNFGRDGKRYTDYKAFKECLNHIKGILDDYSKSEYYNSIAFPYLIGCGLGGGDWNIVKGMIKDFSEKVNQTVYIVALT